jgi:hypothetical protein
LDFGFGILDWKTVFNLRLFYFLLEDDVTKIKARKPKIKDQIQNPKPKI